MYFLSQHRSFRDERPVASSGMVCHHGSLKNPADWTNVASPNPATCLSCSRFLKRTVSPAGIRTIDVPSADSDPETYRSNEGLAVFDIHANTIDTELNDIVQVFPKDVLP